MENEENKMLKRFIRNSGNKKMIFTKRDILQVRAFHVAYRLLKELPVNERFITAICQTSDDRFKNANPALIAEWDIKYGRRRI